MTPTMMKITMQFPRNIEGPEGVKERVREGELIDMAKGQK